MLRIYHHKSVLSHIIHQSIGLLIGILSVYISIFHPEVLGADAPYKVLESARDFYSFIAFFMILILLSIQLAKGYILCTPTAYISFTHTGISFQRLKKEYHFIKWTDIRQIHLKIEGEWLLTAYIECINFPTITVEFTELWLLSLTKKHCVHHNFLKLIAIGRNHDSLMEKLNIEEMNYYLNRATGISPSKAC